VSKPLAVKEKNSDAILDYAFDWTDWLNGDTLDTSSWSVTPNTDLAQVNSTHSTTVATVFLRGGLAGTKYTVANVITTLGGRTNDVNFTLTVK
jgi:hypothetical protein